MRKILLVEDNKVSQLVLTTMLRSAGYAVFGVPNGYAAVNAIKQEPFHLVLMDINMPEMDGFEATQRVTEIRPDAKIIAITANLGQDVRLRCKELGMVGCLGKPVLKDELLNIVRSQIGQ